MTETWFRRPAFVRKRQIQESIDVFNSTYPQRQEKREIRVNGRDGTENGCTSREDDRQGESFNSNPNVEQLANSEDDDILEAGVKTMITFSIREQIQELLNHGVFGASLLTRESGQSQLSRRTCDTPKYKRHLRHYKSENPDKLTLLLSLNIDGFRKKGCSRGEIWPLFIAAHDVHEGCGSTGRQSTPKFILQLLNRCVTFERTTSMSSQENLSHARED
ncbi:unnamed protein product [Caenorhabditis sp. 36 PRJEB53466]|nr:unnamed protein product [Caenorhabditis sp. 36 PRJEB53466]